METNALALHQTAIIIRVIIIINLRVNKAGVDNLFLIVVRPMLYR